MRPNGTSRPATWRLHVNGLRRFLSDTWWIFLLASGCAFGLGYATDVWIMYLFPIACVPVIAYMSAVRYDSSGAIRNASDDEAKRR